MTRADKLLLAGLLSISLLSMAALYGRFSLLSGSGQSARAVITVKGEVIRKIKLESGTRSSFVVEGQVGPSTVEVEGKRVRMLEAPCAGGICVKQNWIGRPGQSIVCIPGQILVRIEGAAPLDAVTR